MNEQGRFQMIQKQLHRNQNLKKIESIKQQSKNRFVKAKQLFRNESVWKFSICTYHDWLHSL